MPSRSSCIFSRRQKPHQLVVYIVICAMSGATRWGARSVLDVTEAVPGAAEGLFAHDGEHLAATVGDRWGVEEARADATGLDAQRVRRRADDADPFAGLERRA